jgi:protoheme IX farnesyltransferase
MFFAYLELCKPRVVLLMLLTTWVGMLLALSPANDFPWSLFIYATLGIAACASAGAVLNHLVERHIDIHMRRTQHRPIACGKISPMAALMFALLLGTIGLFILFTLINALTAWLTLFSLVGYAIIYTLFLKHTTPQNIVIGGAAGAAPPLLGWTAMTNHLSAAGLLLVLIIFIWTPPHFWALAIYRQEDYAKANLPMLPITHGIAFTKFCILLYIFLLIVATLFPFLIHMSGITYLVIALGLDSIFLYYGIKLYRTDDRKIALHTFSFSIVYLMVLFLGLLLDHYLQYWLVNSL